MHGFLEIFYLPPLALPILYIPAFASLKFSKILFDTFGFNGMIILLKIFTNNSL